jgi:lipoprotein NlpI
MGRRLFAALAAIWVAGVAHGTHAAAYDDFAQGLSAYERGDFAAAIPSFTAAIDASDLAPNLKPTAYLDRAWSYVRTDQCASALSDLKTAAALGASPFETQEALGFAASCAGDDRGAEAAFTAAIAIHPKANVFFSRGRTRWASGDFQGAESDFAQVASADPRDAYPVLWLAMARWHRGIASAASVIAQEVASLDLGSWPGSIVQLYLGKAKPEDAIAAAAQGDAANIADQQCEADFYVAEWQLGRHDIAEAAPLLKLAADKCRSGFIEKNGARAELKRLH